MAKTKTTREPRNFEAQFQVDSLDNVTFVSTGGGSGTKASPYDPIVEAALGLKSGRCLRISVPENRSIGSFRLGVANSLARDNVKAQLVEAHGETARFRCRKSEDSEQVIVYIGFYGDGDDDENEEVINDSDTSDDTDWEE